MIFIKHPKLGSGKITRRVVTLTKSRKHRKYSTKLLAQQESEVYTQAAQKADFLARRGRKGKRQQKPVKLQSAWFVEPSIKILFGLWTKLGKPFTKHKTTSTKTRKCVTLLNASLKEHTQAEIAEAFELAHETFLATSFKYHHQISKIGLDEFIGYDLWIWKTYKRKMDFPKSWLAEFLKGKAYIQSKYSTIKKEHAPWMTKQLTDIWTEYKRGEVNTNDFGFKSKMVQFSNLLFRFCKLNALDPGYMVDIIDKSLNDWHTLYLRNLTFALGPTFYKDTLPEELKRYDSLQHGRQQFRHDWRELSQ